MLLSTSPKLAAMKPLRSSPLLALPVLLLSSLPVTAQQSTLADNDALAWGANTGWILPLHSCPQPGSGLRCTESCLSGLIWSANCGWITFGDGTPANGIRYGNSDGSDAGVNLDRAGNLSGLAWGANIGWINLGWAAPADAQRPRIDLCTGEFKGYAWSANTGWINLGSSSLRTETLPLTDTDGDGISDGWELDVAGNLTILTATGDRDGDGSSDRDEFFADTSPVNAGEKLDVLKFWHQSSFGINLWNIQWTSRPVRHYRILQSPNMAAGSWQPAGSAIWSNPSGLPITGNAIDTPGTSRMFYRVEAFLPLAGN